MGKGVDIPEKCWLMIRSGIVLPFVYWGFFNNPRTGNPDFNQPGLNGMIEGF